MKKRHVFSAALALVLVGGTGGSSFINANAVVPFLIQDLSISNTHSIIRSDANEYYVTGKSDHYAMLGRDTNTLKLAKKTLSITLNEGETIEKFDVGYESNLFLTSEGRVFSSGLNQEGQIGNNTIDKFWGKDIPVEITSFFNLELNETIIDIYAGKQTPVIHHALSSFNRFFVWGSNPLAEDVETDVDHYSYFEGKNPSGITDQESIRTPLDISDVFELTTGPDEDLTVLDVVYHSLGGVLLTPNNVIWSWGKNDNGLLGRGLTDETLLEAATQIDLSELLDQNESILSLEHQNGTIFGLTSANRFVAWGDNAVGKIKTSSESAYFTPQVVELLDVTFADSESILDYYVSDLGLYFVTDLGNIWMRGYNQINSIANYKSNDELATYRQDMTWVNVTQEMPVFEDDEYVVEILGIGESYIFKTNTQKIITQYYFGTRDSIIFASGAQNFVSAYYDNAKYYFFIGDSQEPALTLQDGDTFTLPNQDAPENYYHAGWGFSSDDLVRFQVNHTFTFNYGSHFRLYPIFVEGQDPNASSEQTSSPSSETVTSIPTSEPGTSQVGPTRPSAVGPIVGAVAVTGVLGGGFYYFFIKEGTIGTFSLVAFKRWFLALIKRKKDKDEDKK